MAYRKILVPLDGSEISEAILPTIEELASDLKASISILMVTYAHVFPGADPTNAQVAVTKEAEDFVQTIEERLKAKELSMDSHVRYGHAADEILDHSNDDMFGIDLIAMSTHGRSGIGRWLLGSVAEKVLRHSTKPIFLVRHT
ncbi:universal stress protein [Chloroflexota bacterium]